MQHNITVPNLLTIVRLVFSPLLLPFLIVYLLPFNSLLLNTIVAVLFALLSLTDFFDGFLARAFKQETPLGQALDPIADKFLLYATLVSLLAAGKIYFPWVIVLIGREFFMMGLRQVALEHQFAVKVNVWGKFKTMLQMITLFCIIINPYQPLGFHGSGLQWNGAEFLLLALTTGISLFSAYRYYRVFMTHYTLPQGHDEPV